jgi:predicted enzyme related to lactoylglutathione lyase
VPDLEASLEFIERLGGKRVLDPFAVPDGPTYALFADPDGNVVGLARPRPR